MVVRDATELGIIVHTLATLFSVLAFFLWAAHVVHFLWCITVDTFVALVIAVDQTTDTFAHGIRRAIPRAATVPRNGVDVI